MATHESCARGRTGIILILMGLIGALTPSAFAAKDCSISEASTWLNKVQRNHPALMVQDRLKAVESAKVDQAGQRPNPTLNLGANYGSFARDPSYEGNINFQYVFELGDKRDSRLARAQASRKLNDFHLETDKERLLMEATLNLYRLTQIDTLLELYQESIEVFKATRASLAKNKSLSPEQRVQKDVIDIEVGKHRLKIAALESELRRVQNLLQYYSGESCRPNIQAFEVDFPAAQTFQSASLHFPRVRELEIETEVYSTELALENSLAFPDLRIGPSFQWEAEKGSRIHRYGLALTVDLPLLQKNEGGRAAARAQLEATKMKLKYFVTKSQALVDAKTKAYKELVTSLQEAPSKKELLRKHHRIERYFTRGLITISTMLEGHDQLLGLIEERDQTERLALKTLLELQQARGQLSQTLKKWSQR